jgi:carotenoid 1,2-hydratase
VSSRTWKSAKASVEYRARRRALQRRATQPQTAGRMGSLFPIRLNSPSRALDLSLGQAPGGFAWWYVDLVGEAGDGLVLIWSYGLPFLPGYEAAARAGRAGPAGDRPSLYLVTYGGGREELYVFQEFAADQSSWEPGERWTFGNSTIESVVEGGRRVVRGTFDCPVPGSSRLRGSLRIEGPMRSDAPTPTFPLEEHDWTPLVGPAWGAAELTVGDRRYAIEGRAYHDRNGSRTPLSLLGIDHWVWGRLPHPDREMVYYLLWGEDGARTHLVLEIDERGETIHRRDVEVRLEGRRRARYGMPYWERVNIDAEGRRWASVEHHRVVDDGPFYLRCQTHTVVDGHAIEGSGELLRPARVDLGPMRPLVRMKVAPPDGRGSPFLPLFTGPRAGRRRRWARQLLSRGRD